MGKETTPQVSRPWVCGMSTKVTICVACCVIYGYDVVERYVELKRLSGCVAS